MGINKFDSTTEYRFERSRAPGGTRKHRREEHLGFDEPGSKIAGGGDAAMMGLRMEWTLRAEGIRSSERLEFRSLPRQAWSAVASIGDCHVTARGADGQTWTRMSAARHASESGGSPSRKAARELE